MTSAYNKTYYALMALSSCSVAYSIYSAYLSAIKTSAFRIEQIRVVGLADSLVKDVRVSLKPFLNKPLYDVSTQAILDAVLSHALIQKAVVRKEQPNILQIEASEQVPFAIWQSGKPTIIDRFGAPFRGEKQKAALNQLTHLPRIVSNDKALFLEALELLKRQDTWPKALGSVATIYCDPLLGSQIHFEKGLKVFFMPRALEMQWQKMLTLFNAEKVPLEDIAELHFEGDGGAKTASIKWRALTSHNLETGTSS